MADGTLCSFNSATEGTKDWALRFGAEPTDAHISARLLASPKMDLLLNDLFHGGVMAAGNHLYLEAGRINDEGEFQTMKRIHGYSVKDVEGGGGEICNRA